MGFEIVLHLGFVLVNDWYIIPIFGLNFASAFFSRVGIDLFNLLFILVDLRVVTNSNK
jgi:hypothetical protein